ncbi:MAG: class I mannose-6-phosphate isomerase, partial [Pseudomonadota bacterium]|nr:class I mannose-6-phosphate isomerase [Pseudomonadota bacterium]
KEECWLVLDAQPGAQLAIGFDEQLSAEQMESAAKDGSIEELLTWHDVSAGDIFYLPAGTVHAIGAGLTLVEVQQNSDTTFRLYDYGRPRELHLERAMAVADRGPYSARYAGTVDERGEALIDDRYFRLDRIEGAPNSAILANYPGAALVLPLSGSVRLKDSGECAGPGECLYVPDLDTIDFTDAQVSLLTRSK